MTHEFIKILDRYHYYKNKNEKTVLASVVALNGSSYRSVGVRMLISESGEITGAISAGCIEKNILKESAVVINNGCARMFRYDGRLRLGCEGVLHILIEPLQLSEATITMLEACLKKRFYFNIVSQYHLAQETHNCLGSYIAYDDKKFKLHDSLLLKSAMEKYSQEIPPIFRLIIIGDEYDAFKLATCAENIGWQVTVITKKSTEGINKNFKVGNTTLQQEEQLAFGDFDERTALVLMTHNYARDLYFLERLEPVNVCYFGILGPTKRKERLYYDLMEKWPEKDFLFFNTLYAPVGLDIGAETPEEVALAIVAEILAVIRNRKPIMLRNKTEAIHS